MAVKKRVAPLSPEELVRRFPISDLVAGWHFRIAETSAGVYEVEGIDLYGRKVYRRGSETDLDGLLTMCADDARKIQESLGSADDITK